MPWWQSAVLYQIYPRSFLDSDGDGVGDLEGVRARLDHLRWLGVDGVWLSPIYRSPMADFGYDVSDHCAIDPVFGDMEDFDRLLGEAHAGGLRVLLDWVPNHTSDRHPWFVESRSSREAAKRDWYFWRDGRDGKPPNNWRAAFGGRAWTWDDATDQWYLHLFLPEQPDLNWAHPGVVESMHGVLRFWLDRGVDGFRADVVHLIGKDPTLPDQPGALAEIDLVGVQDHPSAHPLLRGIRSVLDSYAGDRVMVGEVNLGTPAQLVPYYGAGDELHMVFNFSLLWASWDASQWAQRIAESEAALASSHDAWPVWVLSNHDTPRHRTRYGGDAGRARVAATVLLTLRGTPFLYAGEELGLLDADVPEAARVDPGRRDGCRAPIPWDDTAGHGWRGEPWLPWPPEVDERDAASLRADEGSILHLYRRLLAARRRSAALHAGTWKLLDAPAGVLAYEREAGSDKRQVWANFGEEPVLCRADGQWVVDVGSREWDGRLGGTDAVVLRPAG